MRKRFLGSTIFILLAVTLVLGTGTAGYVFIEGWNFLDALYMTIITVTTVGYGETNALSPTGRVFTIFIIFIGVGLVLYLLTQMTQMVVEGKLRQMLGRRHLVRGIRAMRDHYIVCGHGRIGSLVVDLLNDRGIPVVVLDNDREVTARLEEEQIPYVLGAATEDENLLAAGIERAKGLVATVSSDANNVYIVLTAKGIRPDLFVIARATEPGSERKLKRAGADKVVSPYFIGARRIAQTVIRPTVADFVELTFHGSDMALQMDEIKVEPSAELAGLALKDSGIRQKLDIIILSIKKADGQMIFNPSADAVIEVGDTLIVLGRRDATDKLGKMLGVEL